jgi:hypothetical protein
MALPRPVHARAPPGSHSIRKHSSLPGVVDPHGLRSNVTGGKDNVVPVPILVNGIVVPSVALLPDEKEFHRKVLASVQIHTGIFENLRAVDPNLPTSLIVTRGLVPCSASRERDPMPDPSEGFCIPEPRLPEGIPRPAVIPNR